MRPHPFSQAEQQKQQQQAQQQLQQLQQQQADLAAALKPSEAAAAALPSGGPQLHATQAGAPLAAQQLGTLATQPIAQAFARPVAQQGAAPLFSGPGATAGGGAAGGAGGAMGAAGPPADGNYLLDSLLFNSGLSGPADSTVRSTLATYASALVHIKIHVRSGDATQFKESIDPIVAQSPIATLPTRSPNLFSRSRVRGQGVEPPDLPPGLMAAAKSMLADAVEKLEVRAWMNALFTTGKLRPSDE